MSDARDDTKPETEQPPSEPNPPQGAPPPPSSPPPGPLRGALNHLIGEVSWRPAPWMQDAGRGCAGGLRWMRRRPLVALGLLTALVTAGFGGVWAVHWYRNRPKPVVMEVTVKAPGLTKVEKQPKPKPLALRFAGSAAPLENVDKIVERGVKLEPKLDGTWSWQGDSRLVFTPKRDWPVGAKMRVELAEEGLLADTVKLAEYELTFETPGFAVSFGDLKFYQDPVDPELKKVVAAIDFSHPVDVPSFEKSLELTLTRDPPEKYKFRVSYDQLKSKAYVHSDRLSIPSRDTFMVIKLAAGIRARRGGPATDKPLQGQVRVPGIYNHLRMERVQVAVAMHEGVDPGHVLVLRSTVGVKERELRKNIKAYTLPRFHPDQLKLPKDKRKPYHWSDPERIDPQVLKRARRLKLVAVPNDDAQSRVHSFRLRAAVGRHVYVLVDKGLKSFGGYILREPYQAIAPVPAFPKVLKLAHRGAILSLAGEKKVAVFTRDVAGLRVTIGRVLPDQLQNLVTQNRGNFAKPRFGYSGLNEEHLTEEFTEQRALPKLPPGKGQYQAIDLAKYLEPRGAARRLGLFLLKVQSWDPETKRTTGEEDRRLILLTNLGIIVKDHSEGHEVFVQSTASGSPVAGARVEVVGRNGLAVLSAPTDATGRAHFPRLLDYKRQQQPTLYLVRHGGDTAFLPFGKHQRYLNLSRFDTGGVTDRGRPAGLGALLFSDRGLYRPGDEIRVGIIVKPPDWKRSLAGLPLELTITDPRGLVVRREKIKLDATGFDELRHSTPETTFTGRYTVSLFIVEDGRRGGLLGSTSVQVREFLPDRMKIRAELSADSPQGWVGPKKLAARITLQNLFGTPAANRRVRAAFELSPGFPPLRQFPGFRFHDWMPAEQTHRERLDDGETDEHGKASFDLDLDRFAAGTYRLRFTAQGFEAEGGRSVTAETSTFVSYMPYLVGYKPDGALHYVPRRSKRSVQLMAVSPKGKRRAVRGLRLALVERRYVSVLARQSDGTYRYDSVRKELQRWQRTLNIPKEGLQLPVPTGKPGDFALVIRRGATREVNRISFSVAGQANVARSLERNSELQVVLKKRDVAPGEAIEMQIKAPFSGAGLITIERDRVYAHKWFKTATSATVQSIRLPADFEGNGYVTVTFNRSLSSDEVLVNPLSYGVAPFTVSRARRTAKIELGSAEVVKPGEPLAIRYRCDRKTKLAIFAVDEGILQVARYATPDPLAYFFKKRALEVRTAQILDLLLPEFSQLVSAPGGGDYDEEDGRAALARNLNPFSRRRQPPVAYWSGIIDGGKDERTVTYQVPDYFNGTLRIVAIAVAPGAVGAAERKTQVRGDFVISPNVPTFVAPGDRFTVSLGVANNVKGSGGRPAVKVALAASKHLEIVGPASRELRIPAMRERSTRFTLRARTHLGSGSLTFIASLGDKSTRLTQDISVRPAAAYLTTLQVGQLRDDAVQVPIERSLFAEYRKLEAGISTLPLGLAHGLIAYLQKFPHGCTEQLVSQAMPAMVLRDRPEFGVSDAAAKTLASILSTLRSRQNGEGGFGLWAANPRTAKFASIYALHFLLEAKERGFAVPPDLLDRGLRWLRRFARGEGEALADERLHAYGLYVLTRAGRVTGGEAAALHRRLDKEHAERWKQDLAGLYLAATYQMLRQGRLAKKTIEGAIFGGKTTADYARYYDGTIRDAQLLYLLARHFPQQAARVSGQGIRSLVSAIRGGRYNTLSSAYAILALDAYARTARRQGGKLTIAELGAGGASKALALPRGLFPRARFSDKARALKLSSSGPFEAFYSVTQAGFDRAPPKTVLKQRLEVVREYEDDDGKPVRRVALGDEVNVHIRLRSLKGELCNLAIVDLLPGGFEVVVQAPGSTDDDEGAASEENDADDEEGEGDEDGDDENDDRPAGGGFALPIALSESTFRPEFGDVREDRVVLYGTASTRVREFIYRIKATAAGTFTVPPIKGESLYDRTIVARSLGGKIKVVKE